MSIKVEHLSYTYPKSDVPVIKDLSFEAPEGCVTVVIGANGVGKSTMIKSMLGIIKAGGNVSFDGVPLHDYTRESLFNLL